MTFLGFVGSWVLELAAVVDVVNISLVVFKRVLLCEHWISRLLHDVFILRCTRSTLVEQKGEKLRNKQQGSTR